jgi:alpha-tubulin suppressor-like RCC1 family protein
MRKIKIPENLTQIEAGFDHVAAIGVSGKLYTMGDDTFGQCGIATFDRQLTDPYLEVRYPNLKQVTLLEGKVVDVKCGKYHTVAVTDDGQAWAWGRNNKHQLGSIPLRLGKAPSPVAYTPQ